MRRKPPIRHPAVALSLRRHPRARDALVGCVAVVIGLTVMSAVRAASDAKASWGPGETVVVATRDIAPGDALDAGNTAVVSRPEAVVPGDAVRSVEPGARAGEAVYAGEVVRAARLAPANLSGLAARLPSGTRAVALPVEPGTAPALERGDRVDVLVALAPEAAGDGPPGFALATGVLVVDVGDASVTVAVSPNTAPRIAVALGQGAVTVALVGAA